MHIWHCPNPERWGAFAGGFEEVDENVEYEERESEFDIVSGTSLSLPQSLLYFPFVEEAIRTPITD